MADAVDPVTVSVVQHRLHAIVEWFERHLAAPATGATSEPAPAVVSS